MLLLLLVLLLLGESAASRHENYTVVKGSAIRGTPYNSHPPSTGKEGIKRSLDIYSYKSNNVDPSEMFELQDFRIKNKGHNHRKAMQYRYRENFLFEPSDPSLK